jgi:hypothetical protein
VADRVSFLDRQSSTHLPEDRADIGGSDELEPDDLPF